MNQVRKEEKRKKEKYIKEKKTESKSSKCVKIKPFQYFKILQPHFILENTFEES